MALPVAHRSFRCDRQCSSVSSSPRLPVVRWHTRAPRSRPCAVLQNDREQAKLAETIDDTHVRSLTSSWLQTADCMPPQVPSPSEDKDTVLHFAYGANMSWSTLARRDVRVLSRDAAFIPDPAVKMVFKHRGGYATIEQQEPGARTLFMSSTSLVHGVLYRVTKADMDKLKKKEGGYDVKEIEVQTYDGKVHRAQAFVSATLAKLYNEVQPTEQYMRKLRDGAADNYLEPQYQAWLSGLETVTSTGLGAEYYNTPSKYVAYSFLAVVALLVSAYFLGQ